MSTLAKKLSDQDRTSEFQIPDGLLKKEANDIQEKHAAISIEIEAVKKELPRKSDESTNVFTLRQVEMAHKVDELESQKSDFENQLMSLLKKQKTQFNGDLQKVSKYLQQESKKSATLDKNILSRLALLASANEELQRELTALKEASRKTQNQIYDLKNGQSDSVYKVLSEIQQSKNFVKDVQQTVQLLKDEILELKLADEKHRNQEKKLQSSIDELKQAKLQKQPVPQPAPVIVEVIKDQSQEMQQKKILFQQHLSAILTPDQQDIVFEMLDDFFASLKKK